jgi:hypothetical protein
MICHLDEDQAVSHGQKCWSTSSVNDGRKPGAYPSLTLCIQYKRLMQDQLKRSSRRPTRSLIDKPSHPLYPRLGIVKRYKRVIWSHMFATTGVRARESLRRVHKAPIGAGAQSSQESSPFSRSIKRSLLPGLHLKRHVRSHAASASPLRWKRSGFVYSCGILI